MKNSGIYGLINHTPQLIYVGQSIDLTRRLKEHVRALSKGYRGNSFFQQDYNQFGKDQFEVKVIEYLDPDLLDQAETLWILHYRSLDPRFGYNETLPGVFRARLRQRLPWESNIDHVNRTAENENYKRFMIDYYKKQEGLTV